MGKAKSTATSVASAKAGSKYRKYRIVFYSCFGAYFVLLVMLYLNGYFSIEDDVAGTG